MRKYRPLDVLGPNGVATASGQHWTIPDLKQALQQWHGGPFGRAVLEANPRPEVMRFPTAAPDLNPQEMAWKATRVVVSHNHDERQLASLADRFEQHLTSTTFSYSLLEKYDHGRICAMFS